MPIITKLYSIQEVAQHNKSDDCWIIVDGKVYDVTSYLDEHPGGDDVMLNATGRDSKEEFDDAGHSQSAIELMQDYFIGELDPSSVPIPEMSIFPKNQKLMDMASQYWTIPVAIVGISVVAAGLLHLRRKIQDHVSSKLEDTHARDKGHGCHQWIYLRVHS